MSKITSVSFLKRLSCKKGYIVALFTCATIFYSAAAMANVCFLPGGKCPGETEPQSIRPVQGESCVGYNLKEPKCTGQACKEGWVCDSCTNAQGTFYKCDLIPTPEPDACNGISDKAWEPGLKNCSSACQGYDHCGFTGNQINGKCEVISDFEKSHGGSMNEKPSPCHTYLTPNYSCGVLIKGENITNLTQKNGDCKTCYANVQKMDGYTTTKPASCTIYNSRRDGLQTGNDNMCYTAGVSIGEYYSTKKRDENIFVVDTQYGKDTFISAGGLSKTTDTEACYKAKGCNAANGWYEPKDFDDTVFEYKQESSDGIICRKATSCRASNQWYNNDDLGQFKDIYFKLDEPKKSGDITCYKAKGCADKAYSTQPSAKYFKSKDKISNNYHCWIVTGKGDYAYDSGDRKLNYFDYTSETKYQYNEETKKFKEVTYYIVNKNNGRNGCMQYAYESEPDKKHFTSASKEQYSDGSSTKKVCWNITGKGEFAYAEGDKKASFFKYDDGLEGYLNGTNTIVKYYNIESCNTPYAYESEPDKKYFSSKEEVGKRDGIDKNISCWNITGKGEYAYTASEKDGKYFAYDSGKEGYLNGTTTIVTYFNILGCGMYAYPNEPDKTFHSYPDAKIGKKGGENKDVPCWIITGKGKYAYNENERQLSYFKYGAPEEVYINGTSTREKHYRAEDCNAPYAYDKEPDAKYFASDSVTHYIKGVKEPTLTCWNITGKGKYAYTDAQKKPLYFKYDNGKDGYLNGTPKKTPLYYNVTGRATGAYATSPDSNVFEVNKEEAYLGGVNNIIESWRAVGCNGKKYYSQTQPDINYFTSDKKVASDIACYIATGCTSKGDVTSTKPGDCRIYQTKQDEFKQLSCYYNIGWVGGDSKATVNNPGHCMRYSAANDTNGTLCYYNIASLGTGYSADELSSFFKVEEATGSDGVKCYRATDCADGTSKTSQKTEIFEVNSDSTSNTATGKELKCYRAVGCNASKGSTNVKPTGCRTWKFSTEGGITCYYNISNEFGKGCVISRVDCYKYSGPKSNTDGVVFYYDPVIMAPGATTNKPSVTDTNCHTFSSGNPSANNGTKTTCYWNVVDITSNKPATTKADENAESADCVDSVACGAEKNCTESETCTYTTTDGCSCGDSQTYTSKRTRNGKNTYTGKMSRSGKKYRGTSYKRDVTCKSDGTGWKEGDWTTTGYSGWSECIGSGSYGECKDGSWSGCVGSGDWGACTGGTSSGCKGGNWNQCTTDESTETDSSSTTKGCSCGDSKSMTRTRKKTVKTGTCCSSAGTTYSDWTAWSYGSCTGGDWNQCKTDKSTETGTSSTSDGCTCGATKSMTRTRSKTVVSGECCAKAGTTYGDWSKWTYGSCTGGNFNQCTVDETTETDSSSTTEGCTCGASKSMTRTRTKTVKSGSCCSSAGTTYSKWSAWTYGACTGGTGDECTTDTTTETETSSTTSGCSCGDSKSMTRTRTKTVISGSCCSKAGTTYGDWSKWTYGSCKGGDWNQCTSSTSIETGTSKSSEKCGCAGSRTVNGTRTRTKTVVSGSCCSKAGTTYGKWSDWSYEYGKCSKVCGAEQTCIDNQCQWGNCNCENGKNQYCYVTGSSYNEKTERYSGLSGICKTATFTTDENHPISITGNIRVWTSGNTGYTWWAADNYCRARGKRLVSTGALNCYKYNSDTSLLSSDINGGGCCAKGKYCEREAAGKYDLNTSTEMQAFKAAWQRGDIGAYWIWLDSNANGLSHEQHNIEVNQNAMDIDWKDASLNGSRPSLYTVVCE